MLRGKVEWKKGEEGREEGNWKEETESREGVEFREKET